MAADKRREERLEPKGVSVWLRYADGAMICNVVNISRTGLGFHLDGDTLPDGLPELHIGTVLKATLRLEETNLAIGLKVLRISGGHLGCALVFPDDATQKRLADLLSPRFAAQSIVPVRQSALGSDIRYAFFGADFYFVAHREFERYQVSGAGLNCHVSGRSVVVHSQESAKYPSEPDSDLAWSMAGGVQISRPLLAEAMVWIVSVLDAWTDKPLEVAAVTEQLRSHDV